MHDAKFDQSHIDHYHEHGYTIIENFLSQDELDAIHNDIDRVIPGWRQAVNPKLERPEDWQEPNELEINPRFPFTGDALNAMTFHPELKRFAKEICGHDDFFCEQSDLTYKCKGHSRDVDQQMHMDFGNHTLAYPSSDPKYWQVTYLVYYTDVTLMHAPTAVVPWQHYKAETHWPIVHTRDDRPDLYNQEVLATVPAGSVFAYSTRTYHRGTAMKGDGGRVAHFISYAPKNCPWLGIVSWPIQGVKKSYHRWVETSSIEEREMLGFPPVAHEYWTEEMVEGVQARFPNLDMTPYIEQLEKN